MKLNPRRLYLVTFVTWLVATCAWGLIRIIMILTEDPRVWGETYVYSLSFQLVAFFAFWLPWSTIFILLPVLLVEFVVMKVVLTKRRVA